MIQGPRDTARSIGVIEKPSSMPRAKIEGLREIEKTESREPLAARGDQEARAAGGERRSKGNQQPPRAADRAESHR